MILGIKDTNTILKRHLLIGVPTTAIIFLIWFTRPDLIADHRLWRAVGDVSFIQLFLTLVIGPAAKLDSKFMRFLSWRRELGIWFAITATIHGVLIFNSMAIQWNILIFLGYVFIPQENKWLLIRSGLGIANILGLLALFWALILAATATDRAVRFLGITSWKFLHMGAHILFYLTSLHVISYMFFVYAGSPTPNPVDANNWFRYPSLIMILIVLLLQILAFLKTVDRQKNKRW
jgi:methionine sulfoxide reductase heme-binding subunit